MLYLRDSRFVLNFCSFNEYVFKKLVKALGTDYYFNFKDYGISFSPYMF